MFPHASGPGNIFPNLSNFLLTNQSHLSLTQFNGAQSVCSPCNKMDLLHARCRMERAFRGICIIALSETLLDQSVTDVAVSLGNFTIIRSNSTKQSGKMCGGGVCLYINNWWCNNFKARHRLCTPNLELLCPFVHFICPRNLMQLCLRCVYVAHRANILDLSYGNIPNAFRARSYSPLGADDHNTISLLPLYRQQLKQHCPQYCITPQRSIACCQGFLATTDWDIFNGNFCYTSVTKLLLLPTT